jgi:cytoskeletal protein CcmA (bactofilin family)
MKMAHTTNRKREHEFTTVLGSSTRLDGKLEFSESLKINGYFEGEIISSGLLYIEQGAKVVADLSARAIIICGEVEGNLTASEKVELLDGGTLTGNIKTATLRMADGVHFSGKCEMIKDPDSVDIFAAPIDTLKKTVRSA